MRKRRFQEAENENSVQHQKGTEGDMMSFEEIGVEMGLTTNEVKKIFTNAMRKLQSPKLARDIWNYDNISEMPEQLDNAGEKL